jgi:peptide-methionine (S)-S-oxide reductase
MKVTSVQQQATFGAGCFWCVEAVFERLDGVESVISGYAGGRTPNPTYKEVCSGTTGHAEVAQITFDPSKVSFEQLLDLFWASHDPTTLNRQGADIGTQYRSVIFYHDDTQREAAFRSKEKAAKLFSDPIITEIVPLKQFHPAEQYHQDYFQNNSFAPYCQFVIAPKLKKLNIPEPKQRSRP